MRLAPILVALSIAACSSSDLTFGVDRRFQLSEVDEIRAAAAKWNGVTVPDARIAFDGVDWWIAYRAPHGGWNGASNGSAHTIEISPLRPDGATVHEVALHEFGHAIGLRHTCSWPGVVGRLSPLWTRTCVIGAPVGVMDPIGRAVAFTSDDLAECRRVEACK